MLHGETQKQVRKDLMQTLLESVEGLLSDDCNRPLITNSIIWASGILEGI